MLRVIDPVSIITTDGQERKLLLTRGALRRIRERLKVKSTQQVLEKVGSDEDGAVAAFLHECLLDRNGLTLEQFEDILPFNVEQDKEIFEKILGVSLPEKTGNPLVPQTGAIQ